MPLVMVETFAEFAKRQGGGQLKRKGEELSWLFPNGAIATQPMRGDRPILLEPPEDDRARLALQMEHATAKVEIAEAGFAALLGQTSEDGFSHTFDWPMHEFGMPPPELDELGQPCGVAALRKIQGIVIARRERVAAIVAEIEALPEARRQRQRQEAERQQADERRDRAETIRQRIAEIEI